MSFGMSEEIDWTQEGDGACVCRMVRSAPLLIPRRVSCAWSNDPTHNMTQSSARSLTLLSTPPPLPHAAPLCLLALLSLARSHHAPDGHQDGGREGHHDDEDVPAEGGRQHLPDHHADTAAHCRFASRDRSDGAAGTNVVAREPIRRGSTLRARACASRWRCAAEEVDVPRSVRSLSLSQLSLTLSPSLPPLSLQSGINANLGQTTYSKESFVITDPFAKKEDETKKLIDQLANFRKIKAKREAMREESEGGLAGMLAADGAPGGAWGGSQSGAQMMGGKAVKRYVPIHERKGAKAMDMTAITDFRDEGHTLRVTNLSMDTKEADLAELFRRFGKTNRIYLAKDRITLESRGFAFVTCVFYVVFV